jgi:lambda family phage minor tail protein L
MTALQHVQELDQSADVFLYELKGFRVSNPNETFRFTNFAGVEYNGFWHPLACSHNAIEITSTGTQPRIEMTISDAANTIGSLLNEIDAIEGAKLRIFRTKARFLGSGATPDTVNGILQRSDMVITRVVNYIPGEAIVCEMSSPLDFGGGETSAPSRCALNKCSWVYRSGVGCTYTGSAMFKLDNTPTLNPAEDKCAKTLSACKARFGEGAVLPFSGFPSMSRR